jgi:hypothetical protein
MMSNKVLKTVSDQVLFFILEHVEHKIGSGDMSRYGSGIIKMMMRIPAALARNTVPY